MCLDVLQTVVSNVLSGPGGMRVLKKGIDPSLFGSSAVNCM